MRRFSSSGLLGAIATAGACTLLNAPADVISGSGGTGGGIAPSSSSTTSASSNGTVSCEGRPDAEPCDDGLYCTVGDACKAGVCVGSQRSCPAPDACNVGVCDESTKQCASTPGNEGGACDDGDPCTGDGTCKAGSCQKGPDACGPLATDCLTVSCTSNGCVPQNVADGTGCGVSVCSAGVCASGHCNITSSNDGEPCDDGLFCTIGDTCTGGFCVGAPNPCPTGTPCTMGTCDETTKSCVSTPISNGGACNDGDPCSAGATCLDGVCSNGGPPAALFSETFADNSKGWTLGSEWQIRPAMASSGQEFGNPDPGVDHTGEGGVAGVVVGGNAAVSLHPSEYLTSPAIDTAGTISLYLTFYRWLNSDYAPFMTNTVEVSTDGMTWTTLWQSAGIPITDAAWTFEAIDVSAYKSATTRFRFGVSVGYAGVYRVSSWNLDDVKVQTAPCQL